MKAFAGLALLHLMGSVLRAVASRERLVEALRSPSSALLALGLLGASALGGAGLVLASALLVCARLTPRPPSQRSERLPWLALAALAVVALARPWVPVYWDEFVWLGKARLESLGFGAGVSAALDPSWHLVPPGYPPLWPLAVGWVSLGDDGVDVHVAASALLATLCAATALEAWWPRLEDAAGPRSRWVTAAVLASAPLALVHLRSGYVDLPVGLLGVAVFGFLVTERLPLACAAAVVLAGAKDEGLAHVLAATAGAIAVHGVRSRVLQWVSPALLGVISVVTWRWLLHARGVEVHDHALDAPLWSWSGTFAGLLARHALDAWSWGLCWPVALASLTQRPWRAEVRGLRWALGVNLVLMAGALVSGPERVRVFAESGTLVNRLLVQVWPLGALLVWFALSAPRPARATGGHDALPVSPGGPTAP
ncbi:MAG: hypothetical protein SFW67_37305 [Myxococcaceae bacterium]|nr:hypothetical protein [Myxococcaceae bacterium]